MRENNKTVNIVHLQYFLLSFYRDARRKVFMNSACNQIKIVPVRDLDSHYLILKLDENLNVTVLSHSLPENDKYFKPIGTIETHSATFFSLYEQMDDFYSQMNTIDELTYVVDPEEITTKHNYRVIKLGKILKSTTIGYFLIDSSFFVEDRVYMKIKVDPLELSSVTTSFYGPTQKVEKYRQLYRAKMDDWNVNDDIYRNLLRIFGK